MQNPATSTTVVPLGPQTLAERVKAILLEELNAGTAGIASVSARLSIRPRTLQRRLNAEGVTLRQLSQAARFEVARRLLETTPMAITKVAAEAGYSDQSNFARAFKRWAGMPPGRLRHEHAEDAAAPTDAKPTPPLASACAQVSEMPRAS